MLFTTLKICVAMFFLFWVYFAIKIRHMVKLAKKIPGQKPSPLWKKLFKLHTGFKTAGK
jgi:hypothetical protein